MSEALAAKYIKNKSILLKLSLRKCKDDRISTSGIKKSEVEIYWLAQLPAGSDFSLTSCRPNDPYWSQYLLTYCKKTKTFHETSYFVPVGNIAGSLKQPVKKCGDF